jgi:hypothetical protein
MGIILDWQLASSGRLFYQQSGHQIIDAHPVGGFRVTAGMHPHSPRRSPG